MFLKNIQMRPTFIALLTAIFIVINLALRWPGALTPDSKIQLNQAVTGIYTDWHPPLMAFIWRHLLSLGDATVVMLILQVTIFWIGIALFSALLAKKGHHLASLIMLISGFTPIALKYSGEILKDSLMTSFFLLAFALASYEKREFRFLGFLFGVVAMLLRPNGVFAFVPLLLLIFRKTLSPLKFLVFFLVTSIALILFSRWVTYDIFDAKKTNVERSLQLYDIAGVANYSNDYSILPVKIDNLSKCYTPLYWDTLGAKRCDYTFKKIDHSITKDWIEAIFTHPLAYIKHRLIHFNYETFFLVPPIEQCVEAPEAHDCPRSLLSDFITKNALLWPITYLVLGSVVLILGVGYIPRILILSALLYGFGYLIVGVASQFRYFYWTEIAITIALIYQIAIYGFPKWRVALWAILIVWILGYIWRFMSI